MPKHQLLLPFLILACGLNAKAQHKIALQHNGSSSFFTDIPSAVTSAASGDTIYLPGGIFPGFDIDKTLTIIGVGHNPDSTMATSMTVVAGSIQMINADCDGSSFTGLRLDGVIFSGFNKNDNIQVSRCYVAAISPGNNSSVGSDNWTITECFISGSLPFFKNSRLSNNLINSVVYEAYNCQIENNVFLHSSQSIGENSRYCTIKNNIFKWFNNGIYSNSVYNCLLYNNIWSDGNLPNGQFGGGNIGIGNINDTNFDGLFEDFQYASYNGNNNNLYPFDFHLINSTYNTGGTNGTAIGLFGGTFPWKAGSVPFNPHIDLKIIAPSTNSSGNLPVQIRAKAQTN